jgi:hypothetical protein
MSAGGLNVEIRQSVFLRGQNNFFMWFWLWLFIYFISLLVWDFTFDSVFVFWFRTLCWLYAFVSTIGYVGGLSSWDLHYVGAFLLLPRDLFFGLVVRAIFFIYWLFFVLDRLKIVNYLQMRDPVKVQVIILVLYTSFTVFNSNHLSQSDLTQIQ